MFLTKRDFAESLRVVRYYNEFFPEEMKLAVAQDFAREIFEEFDLLREDEKREIIEMIINDMSINAYVMN